MHPSKPTGRHTAVGIDGCPGGWIAAIATTGNIRWELSSKLQELLAALPEDAFVLVDMIIGLPESGESSRTCDQLARQALRPYGSRVFPAPPRAALAATSYAEACALARTATGKAISKQCWYLFPKIRELDTVSDPRIRESHPELVFARLKQGRPVSLSKKLREGQAQRLTLLEQSLPGSQSAYQSLLARYPRKQVGRDDPIDALALCAAASDPAGLRSLPESGTGPRIWF